MNAGHVVGIGLGGHRVGCSGHCVCWAVDGQTVGVPGARVGPHGIAGSTGHKVATTGHCVAVRWHSVGVFGVVVGPPQADPTGHLVCWIGHTVNRIGHLVVSFGPGQVVGWAAIGQVVGCAAQTVIAVVPATHWVVIPAAAHAVAALAHWVINIGQVVGLLPGGHSVDFCGQVVDTTG